MRHVLLGLALALLTAGCTAAWLFPGRPFPLLVVFSVCCGCVAGGLFLAWWRG